MQGGRFIRVGKETAVAGVEVALCRQALRQKYGVRFQLDVEVLDGSNGPHLPDGRGIDELARADQLVIREDRVIG